VRGKSAHERTRAQGRNRLMGRRGREKESVRQSERGSESAGLKRRKGEGVCVFVCVRERHVSVLESARTLVFEA